MDNQLVDNQLVDNQLVDNQTITKKSSLYIIKLNDYNLYDYEITKKIILHIEANIIGKLPEILRFFSHYNLIFNFIEQNNNNVLGNDCYNLLGTEIYQLETIFNIDHSKFSKIIQNNDKEQYKNFTDKIKSLESKNNILSIRINSILQSLKEDLIKSIEKSLTPKYIKKQTEYYIKNFKIINCYINDLKVFIDLSLNKNSSINGSLKNIEWIIEPGNKIIGGKNKKYLCASSVFNISHEEYNDLIDDDELIEVHKPSRRYVCKINKNSAELFINKCIEIAFPQIK